MGDQRNKIRGLQFREMIVLGLRNEGVDARLPPPHRKLSEALLDTTASLSDVLGVEGWCLITGAYLQPRWGSAVDTAEHSAALDGTPNAAAVVFRKDRPASDQFVVMTLHQFAQIVRDGKAHEVS